MDSETLQVQLEVTVVSIYIMPVTCYDHHHQITVYIMITDCRVALIRIPHTA
jgi:hypothetical protein